MGLLCNFNPYRDDGYKCGDDGLIPLSNLYYTILPCTNLMLKYLMSLYTTVERTRKIWENFYELVLINCRLEYRATDSIRKYLFFPALFYRQKLFIKASMVLL